VLDTTLFVLLRLMAGKTLSTLAKTIYHHLLARGFSQRTPAVTLWTIAGVNWLAMKLQGMTTV